MQLWQTRSDDWPLLTWERDGFSSLEAAKGRAERLANQHVLAATYGGTKLRLPDGTLEALRERFPRVRDLARSMGFKAECFTGREAHYLRGLNQAQDLDRSIELSRELHRGRGCSQGHCLA